MDVRRLLAADLDVTLELLAELPFFRKAAPREAVRRLFGNPFGIEDNDFGFGLFKDDLIVGVMLSINSVRKINGKSVRVRNLSAWYVKPEFKAAGIAILMGVLKRGDDIVTALTANRLASGIYLKLGFVPLDRCQRVLLPFFHPIAFLRRTVEVIEDRDALELVLSGHAEERQIHRDHLHFDCGRVVLRKGDQVCLCIYTVRRIRGVRAAVVHSVSNPGLFRQAYRNLRNHLLLQKGIPLLLLEERIAPGLQFRFSVTRRMPFPSLYFSKTLQNVVLDDLYSEKVLLNVS